MSSVTVGARSRPGTVTPSTYHNRYRAAHHEAGHAVTAIVTGWPIRYASLAPRRPDAAGHVVWAPHAWQVTRSGCWEPELMVHAAGMAAEALAVGGDPAHRRKIVRHGRSDLEMLRAGCRHVWHRIHNPENYPGDSELRPPVDPAWTVADIAGHAWRRAVQLVWERGPAVCEAAGALLGSSQALTQADLRRIVADAPLTTAEDDQEWGGGLTDADLAFWPGQYSRLAWRPFPPSSCRTSGPGQRQTAATASQAWVAPAGGGPTMTRPALSLLPAAPDGCLERLAVVVRAELEVGRRAVPLLAPAEPDEPDLFIGPDDEEEGEEHG